MSPRALSLPDRLLVLLCGLALSGLAWGAQQDPKITVINPTSGSTNGGTAVTITGSNFVSGATVTIGGVPATNVAFVDEAHITATTPPRSTAGAVDVMVTNPNGRADTLANGFTYNLAPQPTAASINPTSGYTVGGTSVTITGTGFAAGVTVSLGGTAATNVAVPNSTTITATTPAHAAGTVDVAVTNPDTQTMTLAAAFIFNVPPPPTLTSLDPTSGYTIGGTTVTLTGSNFLSGATVSFGGTAATNVSVASPTTITCVTPAHAAGTVNVVLTNPDGQTDTLTAAFTFNVPPPPALSSLDPTSGSSLGGTSVALTGADFLTGVTVTFGGAAATNVVLVNSTRITCTTPAHAAGIVDVVVTNVDGQADTQAQAFAYIAAPVPTVSAISPNNGPSTGGTSVTISGSNFAPGATVTIGGQPATSVVVASDTSITAVTPQHQAGAVDVVVTNTDGQSGTLAGGFTYYTAGIGSGDFRFVTTALPAGEVDKAYNAVVQVEGGSIPTSGLTYIRFGAADLPPGLSLNGLTGAISGEPESAGTFYVTFTATDLTTNDKAVVLLPLLVFPKNSSFQFTTTALDSGVINTPYSFTLTVSGEPGGGGGLKFTALGLPLGLSISDSGVISGAPAQAGTFIVWFRASKGGDSITTNLPLWITPPGSNFRWRTSYLPAAFLNQPYSPDNGPVTLTTQDPGPLSTVYSVSGLPPGISFSTDGVFSGTPVVTGIFPVTFTATDSTTGAQITFTMEFVVFPPNGGDTNSLPINLWAKKASFRRGSPPKDSWQAQWIYNADRRLTTTPPMIYDASTDPLVMALGSIPEVNVPRTSLVGARPRFSYKTLTVAVKLDESSQTLTLLNKNLTIDDRYKSTLRNIVRLGARTYRLDLYFDDKGKFKPALGYRNTAFVVASAKATAKAAAKDALSFSMFLGDPNFVFPAASKNNTVRVRVLNAAGTLVLNKDFTPIVAYTTALDTATGETVYKLKSGKDGTAPLGKFSYDSKSGKMKAAFKGLTLVGTNLLAPGEEQVGVEVVIAEKQYYTSVTLFAPKAGSYSTKLP